MDGYERPTLLTGKVHCSKYLFLYLIAPESDHLRDFQLYDTTLAETSCVIMDAGNSLPSAHAYR
jgi:hypothetical protein